MIPLRHCFRFSVYLSLESLTLCSAEAAAEETYSPCTSGQFHYLICQTKTGTPRGPTWTNGRWWKQTNSLSISPSMSILEHVVFSIACLPILQVNEGRFVFLHEERTSVSCTISLFPILPCLIFLFVSLPFLNKASVLKNKIIYSAMFSTEIE